MGAIKVVGRRALIGRGFLGFVLDQPGRFTDRYHSKNIDQLRGSYDLIVIAAPYASKWWANDNAREDSRHCEQVAEAVARTSARKVVLLSTIDATFGHPYGAHRAWLEREIIAAGNVHTTTIIRLPALFGNGLRKNALFDLLTGKRVANQVYHWYNVAGLWEAIRKAQPGLWCPYSAPLSMWEIAERLGLTEQVTMQRDPTKDYNEKGPFTMTSEEALNEIATWATSLPRPAASRQSASLQDPTSPRAES